MDVQTMHGVFVVYICTNAPHPHVEHEEGQIYRVCKIITTLQFLFIQYILLDDVIRNIIIIMNNMTKIYSSCEDEDRVVPAISFL